MDTNDDGAVLANRFVSTTVAYKKELNSWAQKAKKLRKRPLALLIDSNTTSALKLGGAVCFKKRFMLIIIKSSNSFRMLMRSKW